MLDVMNWTHFPFLVLLAGSCTIAAADGPKGGPFPSLGGNNAPAAPLSPMQRSLMEAARFVYQESRYQLHPDVELPAEHDVVARKVLDRLTRNDFVPEDRVAHYSWCDWPDVAVIGWSGRVFRVTKRPNGWLYEVYVSPKLVRLGSVATVTLDIYTEWYFINKDLFVHYLGGRSDIPNRMCGLLDL